MGERISTERAQELVAACALTADDLRFVHPDGTPIGCTYSEGDKCRTCGGAHMVDLNDWGEHLDGCAAAAVEMRVKPARRALGAAAEAALLDLIAARERIAALEAERDAARELRGVPVEEHARAVREAWVVFCRPLYADRGRAASDADIAEHWRECDTRTRLIARLVGSGLTEAQAVALADGAE